MNAETEKNIKYLDEKINQTIALIDKLRSENDRLLNLLKEMQERNNQAIEKINLILDKIAKIL